MSVKGLNFLPNRYLIYSLPVLGIESAFLFIRSKKVRNVADQNVSFHEEHDAWPRLEI